MRKLYYFIVIVALCASSCVKDLDPNGNGGSVTSGNLSPDFEWKTVRDMKASVAVPTVNGAAVDYAVVRIYSSPILTAENLVAQGVTKPSSVFNTSFTVPTGVNSVYVQTTLPDGTKSVKSVEVQASAAVAGAEFKIAAAPRIGIAAEKTVESSMPAYPVMEPKSESDFPAETIIRSIDGKNYQLGASWAFYAAEEYYIPAGVEITDGIDLNGGFQPFPDPVLYVAGKLTVTNLGIGKARLAVLPGGVVTVKSLTGNGSGDTSKPSIYVFEGGKFILDGKANLGNRTIVNCGEFLASDDVDLNNSAAFYNVASARFVCDELKCSNSVVFHNDGDLQVDDLKLNSDAAFYNYENGRLEVADDCEFDRNTVIYQRGLARIHEMTARGTIYVNCYTVVGEIEGEKAQFNFSAGAALDAEEVEFNNTTVSLASGAVFTIDEYNTDDEGDKNYFTAVAGADPRAVVVIRKKAYTRKGHATYFTGPLEVVYDNSVNKNYSIGKDYLTDGAVLVEKQTVVLPQSVCNGGKVPVDPDGEPEPAPEYNPVAGAAYTYCFEDNWPWFGDYDMNDVVVVSRIDRNLSKDGSKVSSLKIRWELKAAGTTYDIAMGIQMDKVPASQIASVEHSHKGFGSGFFAAQGLEAGQRFAVLPLFNHTDELLASSNTWPGQPAAAVQQNTTTVVFTEPVAAEDVSESSMNYFIAVKSRHAEIHMPSFNPTDLGELSKGYTLLTDPYKFFVKSGDRIGDNYMMWALMVPGEFRYPAENKDIRHAYPAFLPWASSNGAQHREWYLEDAIESEIYQ